MAKTYKRKPTKKRLTKKRRGGDGIFDILVGAQRIRGQKYEHWLEERLVLHFNDVNFVNKVRVKFNFDKTNLIGRGQFTKQMMVNDVCSRDPADKNLIAPRINCQKKQKQD
jgi:hypothetical protein